ncbi:hypothetical protein PRIPAC_72011 [Pristionchus pacificus]|uniref:Uncharacterized protein n=1 Tax=Pristionchus pacificus TaxID=54126 RepID=A0A2A6C173_PRIPA|nr:hypothetical protein PRIPAC_72011 [Pristionchus pacificus]|eukprot:PDM71858.1 hypothetical protein PRIPAC_38265 [Pristionchus pacificus]
MKLLLLPFCIFTLSQAISVSDKPLSELAEYEIAGRFKSCKIDLEKAAIEALELYSGFLAKQAIAFREKHPCDGKAKPSTTVADGYFQFSANFVQVKPALKQRATKFHDDYLACKIEGAAALKELNAIVKENYVIWLKALETERKCK